MIRTDEFKTFLVYFKDLKEGDSDTHEHTDVMNLVGIEEDVELSSLTLAFREFCDVESQADQVEQGGPGEGIETWLKAIFWVVYYVESYSRYQAESSKRDK